MWAAWNPGNRCLAFEASPRNLEMLNDNVTAAGFADRIEVRAYAVGRVEGQMNFDLGPEDQTGWGGLANDETNNCVTVEVKRLADVLAPDLEIAVLKIDTEGADAWVLEGAEQLLLEKRVRHVFYECNLTRMSQLGIDPEWPQSFLRDCGYRVELLKGAHDGSEFHATPSDAPNT